jgi:hypothetical protein
MNSNTGSEFWMRSESINLAFQAHMAEYAALRQELLEIIKWRDRLVFSSLGISGALISFSLSSSSTAQADATPRRLALYLVAPLASVIGGLWFVNSWRIHRIGAYLRDVIAVRVNLLLTAEGDPPSSRVLEVLSWEQSAHRLQHKWLRRITEWLTLVVSFVLTGVIAQFLIVRLQPGPLWRRILNIEMPMVFVLNCVMLAACGGLLVHHLLIGRSYRSVSPIRPPGV